MEVSIVYILVTYPFVRDKLNMRKSTLALFSVVVLLSFLILMKTPVRAEHFFAGNSTWYTKIPTNPTLYPNAANYTARLVASKTTIGYSHKSWSVPIFYATASTPLVHVNYSGPRTGIPEIWVPIPDNALPAGYSYTVAAGGSYVRDSSMAIISADRKWAWDFFLEYNEPSTGAWRAYNYRKWNLESTGILQPVTPADPVVTPEGAGHSRACPTTLLHGLVTYKEAVVDKYIDHALAFIYGGTGEQFALGGLDPIYPCETSEGSGWYDHQWSPPLGMRFQMDPTINVDTLEGLTPTEKVIARALQEYGMIYVESTGAYNNGIYMEDLEYDSSRSWDGLLIDDRVLHVNTAWFRPIQPLYPTASTSTTPSSSTTSTVSSTSSTSSTPVISDFEAIRVHTPVSIDGQLTEAAWLQATPINFSNSGRSNNSSSMKVIWDREAVYVGAEITDSQIDTTGTDLWIDDSIEIFFDTSMNKTTSIDSDDVQVIVNAEGEVSKSGVVAAKGNKTGGYILEVKIPWSVMNVTPGFMEGLGMLLANNDRDAGVVTSYDNMGIIDISQNIFKRPNLWGSIETNVSTKWRRGDYTNDTSVGLPDFAVFAGKYKTSGIECEYDLVGDDCYLNIGDFQTFATNYGS